MTEEEREDIAREFIRRYYNNTWKVEVSELTLLPVEETWSEFELAYDAPIPDFMWSAYIAVDGCEMWTNSMQIACWLPGRMPTGEEVDEDEEHFEYLREGKYSPPLEVLDE